MKIKTKIFGIIIQQDKVDGSFEDDTLTSDNRTKVYNDSWIQQVVSMYKVFDSEGNFMRRFPSYQAAVIYKTAYGNKYWTIKN